MSQKHCSVQLCVQRALGSSPEGSTEGPVDDETSIWEKKGPCEDHAPVLVKGPIMTHMYHQEVEGQKNMASCQYVFTSMPLHSGKYKFVFELRSLRGNAYHAQPSDVKATPEMKRFGICRVAKEILAKTPVFNNGRNIIDRPVAPGVVSFQVAEHAIPTSECDEWMSRGAWSHWSKVHMVKEKCGGAFQCSDLEPRDDFIWCSTKFAYHTLFRRWIDFRKALDINKRSVAKTTKIVFMGSSLANEMLLYHPWQK